MPPQPRLFEPPRHRELEDSRPGPTEAPPGDDKNAAPTGITRLMDKSGERVMSLGLGHSVQIEPAFDRTETALQPFGIGAVYPGEAVRGGQPIRLCLAPRLGRRLASRGQDGWLTSAQRLHTVHGFAPQPSIAIGEHRVIRLRHCPFSADCRRG